jgi:hypothetical protein
MQILKFAQMMRPATLELANAPLAMNSFVRLTKSTALGLGMMADAKMQKTREFFK